MTTIFAFIALFLNIYMIINTYLMFREFVTNDDPVEFACGEKPGKWFLYGIFIKLFKIKL